MPSLEERQVSNIVFFLQDRWRPTVEVTAESQSHPARDDNYRSLSTLEAFLWLHEGVQADYFPRVESRRITYEYFPLLLKSYEYVLTNKLDQRFSPPLQQILDSELSGRKDLFALDEGWQRPPENSLNLFQSALILANGFAADSSSGAFTDALAFSNEREWTERVREFRASREIDRTGRISSRDSRELLISSVFSVIHYMEVFHEFMTKFDEASVSLKERIKELQRWRLDFGNQRTFAHFNEMLEVAVSVLRPAAEDEWDFLRSGEGKGFVETVRRLMIDWGAPPLSFQVGR